MAQGSHFQPHAPGPLCLWYDQPTKAWMIDALPPSKIPLVPLRYLAGITRDSRTGARGELASVYVICVLTTYWLIERSMVMFLSLA